ncbi:MAG: SDR family oxidoreductase [Bacteroidota bacterium]
MTALITGATKGIGLACCHAFAPHCKKLIIIARTRSDLSALKTELALEYPALDIIACEVDLSITEERQHFLRVILRKIDQLDVLINNVGRFDMGGFLEEPEGRLQAVLDLNLLAAYDCCRAFVPLMKAQKQGHIFNVCSIASFKVMGECASYIISKHALLGLSKVLRQALLDEGVRVTTVMPGATWSDSWAGAPFPEDRLMPAEAIAKTILHCWQLPANVVVEDVVIRPQEGDL